MKKIAVDSYYEGDTAYNVGVVFRDLKDSQPLEIIKTETHNLSPYIPGEFYKRELPGILSILEKIELPEFDTIILDGFYKLYDGKEIRPGLGMKLEEALGEHVHSDLSIWCIAKSDFIMTSEISELVRRGKETKKPLYVQASRGLVGVLVKEMHGEHRIPTILKILDKETKKIRGKG